MQEPVIHRSKQDTHEGQEGNAAEQCVQRGKNLAPACFHSAVAWSISQTYFIFGRSLIVSPSIFEDRSGGQTPRGDGYHSFNGREGEEDSVDSIYRLKEE
jgi:hypothetical protein